MATTSQEDQKELQQLFSRFWERPTPNTPLPTAKTALGACLVHLSAVMGKELTPEALRVYLAALMPYPPAKLVPAFVRAVQECKYFPSPAELLDFAGRVRNDSTPETEARGALLSLVGHMREFGWKLQDKLGAIKNDGMDAQCRVMQVPEREPSTPAPVLPEATEAALYVMGNGNRMLGLEMLRPYLHPIGEQEARLIDRRWVESYALGLKQGKVLA